MARPARRRVSPPPPKGGEMAIEYLLVTFPEPRAVLADGNGVGFTNHTLMLPTDEYLISLAGTGYQPPNQDIALSGTSLVKPMVISFTLTGAGAGVTATPPPAPPGAPPGGPPARRSGK